MLDSIYHMTLNYFEFIVWTHGRTDGHQLEPHPISLPGAFGSGELKMLNGQTKQFAC